VIRVPNRIFENRTVNLVNGSEPGTLIRWQTLKRGRWWGAKGNRAGRKGERIVRRMD